MGLTGEACVRLRFVACKVTAPSVTNLRGTLRARRIPVPWIDVTCRTSA
jgi:hypothetical protein